MAGAKLSPRQKMINMMYLVLMALLALNVSAEILKSFFFMEQSFISAAENIDQKNATTMKGFEKKMEENALKTRPYYERAQQAEKIAEDFVSYVNETQAKIEEMYGGRKDGPNSPLTAADQMEKHSRYFVKIEQGKNGKEFMARINSTRDELVDLLKPDPSDTNITIKNMDLYNQALSASQLNAEDEPAKGKLNKKGWVQENLEHNPAAGLMALFARIKNDAKTLESDVLTKLAQQIDATDYKFDKLEAKVLAKSSAIMSGGQYEADILLVASNSKGVPVIKLADGTDVPVVNGVGKLTLPASGTGSKTFAGEIVVSGPEGDKPFPFEAEYTVFNPAATIAATEMNLLYVGLNNPMQISVPGFTNINVGYSKGIRLSAKGNGNYNAKVDGSAREVSISVSVTVDGKSKSVGSQKFRVRRLPNPMAQLGGLLNDGLPKPKAQVQAQGRLIATMGQGFAYNLTYRINSFRMIYAPRRGEAKIYNASGAGLSGQMQSKIRSAKKGDRILFEGIKATEAKYGFKANLSPIVITIR